MPKKKVDWFELAANDYTPEDVFAVQALAFGTATPEQQKLALKWIVERACLTYDVGFDSESERISNHLAGRRFAGLQIVKLTTLRPSTLRSKQNA